MESAFLNAKGDLIRVDELRVPKARDLALKMESEALAYASLVECRKNGDEETIIFDVDIEVSQVRVHSIQASERIAVTFLESDTDHPKVEALRKDFPRVPHLVLHREKLPRRLCLAEEHYDDIKPHWTSARFVNRIRDWLEKTARGELHGEDQPLEPILLGHVGRIVIPPSVLDVGSEAQPLHIGAVDNGQQFLIAQRGLAPNEGPKIIASVHRCAPQTHGVIYQTPTTLVGLAELTASAGLDLLADLRNRLLTWKTRNSVSLDALILLVIQFPKKRSEHSEVEIPDPWAFFLGDAAQEPAGLLGIRDLGIKLGLWEMHGTEVGFDLKPDMSKCGNDVALDVLNVSLQLTQEAAALLNGKAGANQIKITAVGLGALGSQVVLNLARGGFGKWILIDHDRLMPHNLARHALSGRFIWHNKAEAVSLLANSIVPEGQLFSSVPVDALTPGDRLEDIKNAFGEAEVILDISTSVGVARKLVHETESEARRVSLFMTPSGRDLVLLAEDKQRAVPLDALEMQYYRAVANNKALTGHFQASGQRHRYGQSCRDITSTLPQNLVALHAAIGAAAIEDALAQDAAVIAVWRADAQRNVQRVDVTPEGMIRHQIFDWTVVTDKGLMEKLGACRENKLPNETGGVLLGKFDLERMIVYIVDALPSPPDSEEWPTHYIRGCKGLQKAVAILEETTHGMLEYIGEWHSHPRGVSLEASSDDIKVFASLTNWMAVDGLPAVMMMVGEKNLTGCYVGQIVSEERLLPVTDE